MSPLVKKIQQDNYIMGVWKTKEDEGYYLRRLNLTPADRLLLENAKTKRRKLEILSVRLLIKSLGVNVKIEYSSSGMPLLDKGNISISHTKYYSAVIYHKSRKVAIDIEKVSAIPAKGKHLVFNRSEIEFAKNRPDLLTTMWCCKECIVKMTDNVNVNYLTQVSIQPFSRNGIIECNYFNEGGLCRYNFHHSMLNDHIIVWGLDASVQ